MEVRPGYKQTEVGVIPKEWDVLKVESIIDEISMGPFGSDITVSNFVSSGVPVLSGLNVASERLMDSFKNFVTTAKARSLKKAIARKGDIVVTHRGTIGQIAYIPENAEFDRYVVSQSQFRVRFSKDAVIPAWVVLYFHSKNGAKRLLKGRGHTGVPAIAQPTRTFRNLSIPVPPIPEQRTIAMALSDVDSLLEGLGRLIAKKRNLKQAVMQQLLTGKTRLPGFHGEWEVTTLSDSVAIPITDGPHLTPKFLPTGIPFLSVNNLVSNLLDFSSLRFISMEDHIEFSKKCKPRRGDILFGKAASVGMVALIETDMELNIWSPLALIRVARNMSKRFVFYALQGSAIGRQIKLLTNSSSQGNIGMSDIGLLQIPLPSMPEQEAIAFVLSDMDAELAALESRRDKTQDLKQAMMQELLTGRTRLI